jgi:hypothetical protein
MRTQSGSFDTTHYNTVIYTMTILFIFLYCTSMKDCATDGKPIIPHIQKVLEAVWRGEERTLGGGDGQPHVHRLSAHHGCDYEPEPALVQPTHHHPLHLLSLGILRPVDRVKRSQ